MTPVEVIAWIMLEKGLHFMAENRYARHDLLQRYADGTTNMNDVVEHDPAFMSKLAKLAMNIISAREASDRSRSVYDALIARAKRRRALLDENFRNPREKLLAQIEDIFDNFDPATQRDAMNKAIYYVMYELDESRLIIYKNDIKKVYENIEYWNTELGRGSNNDARALKEIIDDYIDIITERGYVTHTDINDMREQMANALGVYYKKVRTDAPMDMLLHNYIDKEMVVRLMRTQDGGLKVVIPSRLESPLELSEEMIDNYGLREMVDFMRAILADTEDNRRKFSRVFRERMYDRFSSKADWDKEKIGKVENLMIDTLLKNTGIDIVLGRAALARGLVYANARVGITTPERGLSIWMGQFILDTLRNNDNPILSDFGRTNHDFLRESWLEEIQHHIWPERAHVKAKYGVDIESYDADQYVWHSGEFDVICSFLARKLQGNLREKGSSSSEYSVLIDTLREQAPYIDTVLMDAMRDPSTAPYPSLMQTADELRRLEDGALRFLERTQDNGVAVNAVFLIDPALSDAVRQAIQAEVISLQQQGYENVSWIHSTQYNPDDHGEHFAYFIGHEGIFYVDTIFRNAYSLSEESASLLESVDE